MCFDFHTVLDLFESDSSRISGTISYANQVIKLNIMKLKFDISLIDTTCWHRRPVQDLVAAVAAVPLLHQRYTSNTPRCSRCLLQTHFMLLAPFANAKCRQCGRNPTCRRIHGLLRGAAIPARAVIAESLLAGAVLPAPSAYVPLEAAPLAAALPSPPLCTHRPWLREKLLHRTTEPSGLGFCLLMLGGPLFD